MSIPAHPFQSSISKAEADKLCLFLGYPALYKEFQATQRYTGKACFKGKCK